MFIKFLIALTLLSVFCRPSYSCTYTQAWEAAIDKISENSSNEMFVMEKDIKLGVLEVSETDLLFVYTGAVKLLIPPYSKDHLSGTFRVSRKDCNVIQNSGIKLSPARIR